VDELLADRRKHPRIATEIVLRGMPEDGGESVQLVTENVSMGGVYCTSSVDLPEMTCLAVQMTLPGAGGDGSSADVIDVQAVVVRRELVDTTEGTQFKLALLFTYLDERATDLLSKYLAEQAKKAET
jgi:hypothetical protein